MFWSRKPKIENPYITLHRLKIQNDNRYLDYLKWCASVCEIPMDKYDFIKEITEKENELNALTK